MEAPDSNTNRVSMGRSVTQTNKGNRNSILFVICPFEPLVSYGCYAAIGRDLDEGMFKSPAHFWRSWLPSALLAD